MMSYLEEVQARFREQQKSMESSLEKETSVEEEISIEEEISVEEETLVEKRPLVVEKRSMVKRARPWILDVIVAAVMITATLLFLQNDDPKKSLFGYRYYFVQSGSMEPELPLGSFILVKLTEPEEIRVGDNVSFYFAGIGSSEPTFWTHKVIEIVKNEGTPKFQTQGVANPSPDPFVLEGEHIIGKVIYCNPTLGPVLMFASKNPLPIIAVIGALVIFLYAITFYRRRRRQKPISS
jgi:signal peptidase